MHMEEQFILGLRLGLGPAVVISCHIGLRRLSAYSAYVHSYTAVPRPCT